MSLELIWAIGFGFWHQDPNFGFLWAVGFSSQRQDSHFDLINRLGLNFINIRTHSLPSWSELRGLRMGYQSTSSASPEPGESFHVCVRGCVTEDRRNWDYLLRSSWNQAEIWFFVKLSLFLAELIQIYFLLSQYSLRWVSVVNLIPESQIKLLSPIGASTKRNSSDSWAIRIKLKYFEYSNHP